MPALFGSVWIMECATTLVSLSNPCAHAQEGKGQLNCSKYMYTYNAIVMLLFLCVASSSQCTYVCHPVHPGQ